MAGKRPGTGRLVGMTIIAAFVWLFPLLHIHAWSGQSDDALGSVGPGVGWFLAIVGALVVTVGVGMSWKGRGAATAQAVPATI
jgi:hypothetical protein